MKFVINPKVYPDLTEPNGLLSRDMRCQACWTFYTLAEQKRIKVGRGPESQILLEGELWMDKDYDKIAKAVCTMYKLDSPDDWKPFWPQVALQAVALGYGSPHPEYVHLKRFI